MQYTVSYSVIRHALFTCYVQYFVLFSVPSICLTWLVIFLIFGQSWYAYKFTASFIVLTFLYLFYICARKWKYINFKYLVMRESDIDFTIIISYGLIIPWKSENAKRFYNARTHHVNCWHFDNKQENLPTNRLFLSQRIFLPF